MKHILYIFLILPSLVFGQIEDRNKIVNASRGLNLRSQTNSAVPSGDLRYIFWNPDSGRFVGKINSTTFRGLLFNGEGGGGSGVTDGDKGDITVSASGATWTVDNTAITFAKLQNIATARILGRTTASSGSVEELTVGAGLSLSGGVLNTAGTAWLVGGNTIGGTVSFGAIDNNHIDILGNNTVRGRFKSDGEFLWGSTSDLGAWGVQIRLRTLIMSTPVTQNEFMVDDDGANGALATSVFNPSGSNNRNIMATTINGDALTVRRYGQSTDLFTIGSFAGSANAGAPLTHLYADAATTGRKYAYGAYNTYSPASGDGLRYAFEDSTVRSGGGGTYGSFYSHVVCTSCGANDFAFKNTVNNNYYNTVSGVTVVGSATAGSEKFQVVGSVAFDLGSDATGDVFYRNSGGAFTRLGIGSNGDVLTVASGLPSWAAPSGGSGITSINSETGPAITIAGANGNTVSASSNTVTVSSPYTLIYSDTSQTSVSNTTTETSLLGNIIGSASIDGSTLTAGSVLILRGYGTISVDATPANCEFDFTISNFTLGLTATGLSNSLTNAPFEYEFEVSPFALGTDQFAFYRGKIEILDGSTIKRFTGNAKYSFFTTTGSLTVDVTAQWATANSNNTVTSRNNTCEVKRRQ